MELTELILKTPENFLAGFQAGSKVVLPLQKRVVIAGMGGSILAAELLVDFLSQEGVEEEREFKIWSDYFLPATELKQETVVLCLSYSGNTEETLSVFHQAKEKGLPVWGIGRGGKLKELAGENFLPIPDFFAPRFAVPYFLGLLFGLLLKEKLSSFAEIRSLNLAEGKTQASSLVEKINDKLLLVYSSRRWKGLAHFWEVNFEETAKTPVFVGIIPEINHHQLVGFSRLTETDRFLAIFLKDPDDLSRLNQRIELTAEFFVRDLRIESLRLELQGQDNLTKLLSQLGLVYLTSLALAERKGVEPLDISLQERFKQELIQKK